MAEKVRVGLEPEVTAPTTTAGAKTHYLDEVWVRKPIRRHIAEFSCVMALVLLAIAGYCLYKGSSLATVCALTFTALLMILLGYRTPGLLHPVWKSWMTLATALGLVVTTIILSIGWALLIIPFAVGMKIVGKRVMDLSYATGVASYWDNRDPKYDDFKFLERQF